MRVFGDWHSNIRFALGQVQAALDAGTTTILHVGDFGFWPSFQYKDHFDWASDRFLAPIEWLLAEHGAHLYWIDGNHENFAVLKTLPIGDDGLRHVSPHIAHLPRGYVWEWDSVRFAAMGGADSVDREIRLPGRDWFAEEQIARADVDKTLEAGKVDVLLTHEAPILPVPYRSFGPKIDSDTQRSRDLVSELMVEMEPQVLIHGHYHKAYQEQFGRTLVVGLDCDQGIGRNNFVDLELLVLAARKNKG